MLVQIYASGPPPLPSLLNKQKLCEMHTGYISGNCVEHDAHVQLYSPAFSLTCLLLKFFDIT